MLASVELRENRKSGIHRQKALTRADFTPGSIIGAGAYGTVFNVKFKDGVVEKKVNP